MTLTQLKHYIQTRQAVTLNELSHVFASDPKTIELMMQHWTDTGMVDVKLSCDDCLGCMTACQTYVWQSNESIDQQ